MYDVRITAIRCADYRDLQALYENPIEHTCSVCEGQQWVSHAGERPDGFCDSAWESMRWFVAEQEGQTWVSKEGRMPEGMCESAWGSMREFVEALSRGEGNFYDGWMRNPYSALISCNDGFRPVSFLLERLEPGT